MKQLNYSFKISNKTSQSKVRRDGETVTTNYPNGYFRDKQCSICGTVFTPSAPGDKYCSCQCSERALATRYLERTYGITLLDYELMYHKQDGLCAICHTEGFKMAEHHNVSLVVDHDHVSGQVRGLLCHNCNRALGLLKDSKYRLCEAINYLQGSTTSRKA